MACAIEPARTEPRHAGGRCVARGPGVKGDRPDKEATARIAWSANRPIVVTVFATSTSSPPNAGRTWAYGRSVLPCSARGEVEVGEHPFPSAWCSPRSVAWRFVPRGRLGEQRRELTSRLIVMGATLRKAGRVLEYFHGTFGVVTPLRVARLMVALSQGPVREGEVRMVSLPPRSPPPPERPPPPSSSAPPGSPPPFRRPAPRSVRAGRFFFATLIAVSSGISASSSSRTTIWLNAACECLSSNSAAATSVVRTNFCSARSIATCLPRSTSAALATSRLIPPPCASRVPRASHRRNVSTTLLDPLEPRVTDPGGASGWLRGPFCDRAEARADRCARIRRPATPSPSGGATRRRCGSPVRAPAGRNATALVEKPRTPMTTPRLRPVPVRPLPRRSRDHLRTRRREARRARRGARRGRPQPRAAPGVRPPPRRPRRHHRRARRLARRRSRRPLLELEALLRRRRGRDGAVPAALGACARRRIRASRRRAACRRTPFPARSTFAAHRSWRRSWGNRATDVVRLAASGTPWTRNTLSPSLPGSGPARSAARAVAGKSLLATDLT